MVLKTLMLPAPRVEGALVTPSPAHLLSPHPSAHPAGVDGHHQDVVAPEILGLTASQHVQPCLVSRKNRS